MANKAKMDDEAVEANEAKRAAEAKTDGGDGEIMVAEPTTGSDELSRIFKNRKR